jgi:hypothetical protein
MSYSVWDGVSKQFAKNVVANAKPAVELGADPSPPPCGSDAPAACQISQSGIQTCVFGNVILDNCTNVSLKCDSSAQQNTVSCDLGTAVANVVTILNQQGYTTQQQYALLKVIQEAGGVVPDLDPNNVYPSWSNLCDILISYYTARCTASQTASQTVVFPKVLLQGPTCDNDALTGANQLTQNASCVMNITSQLLALAGLSGNCPAPYAPPPTTRWSAVTLFSPPVTVAIIGAVPVLIMLAVLIGYCARFWGKKI